MLSNNLKDYVWGINEADNPEPKLIITPKENFHYIDNIYIQNFFSNNLEKVINEKFFWYENIEEYGIKNTRKFMNKTKIEYSSEFEKVMNTAIYICPCLACTEPYMFDTYDKNASKCSKGFRHRPIFKNIDFILTNILINF
uniref:Uncharacterized protein n=1 Tax=Pithovirus LCDPAC02 TaxID=2506601 RepID=A0A481YNX1_9VIRU|nr:MAG: hypothetical protein LCDPAC02_02220 [Pithovirus LCDPAC02]